MSKPPRNHKPTDPSNLTFDFVTHAPPRSSATSATSAKPPQPTTPQIPETAHESETLWQAHPTQPTTTPLPQGYKQTEVGIIPDNWEVTEIFRLDPFVTSGSRGWSSYYVEFGDLFLRITNLSRRSIYLDLKDSRFVKLPSNETEGTRTKVRIGDILISITADIGTIGYITKKIPQPAYINQHIALVRLNNGAASSLFISYFLSSEHQQNFFASLADQGAKAGINLHTIQKILIPLPPLEEQEAIAEALSDADALVDALERLLWKKRRLKEGAMQELLTGRTRLPEFTKSTRYKQTEVGTLPEDWVTCELKSLADPKDRWSFVGGPFGSNLKSSDYTKEGVRVIQLQNIGEGEFKEGEEIYTSSEKADFLLSNNIYPGEIILSKMGVPVARACIVPFENDRYLMCSDGIRLSVNKNAFDTNFIHAQINTQKFRKSAEQASTGSTRKRIGLGDLRKLSIPAPPLEEQEAIAEVLCGMDEEIEALEEKLAKARQVKQGMMQELLTGRIRLI